METNHSKQFHKNLGVMSEEDLDRLEKTKVIIIGLGGLGGNIANNLVRLGVGELLLIDFDRFMISNLNRQLFSNFDNIGSYKVEIIKEELLKINPECNIETEILGIEDIENDKLMKYDYIIDAVDSPQTKIYISEIASTIDKPLLHAACAGWFGQIGWIMPGCNLIKDTYGSKEFGLELEMANPSFTPSVIAGIMTSEFLKFIQKDNNSTINQYLLIDLLTNSVIKTGKKDG